MEITGTREAFAKMLEQRGISSKLGVERSTVSNWRKYLAEEKSISLDKMEEMLQKYGADVIREKTWMFPKVQEEPQP